MDSKRTNLDLYTPMQEAVRAVSAIKYKRVVGGKSNIPERPAIFVANHERFEDSFLIALAIESVNKGMKTRFGAKKGYFEGKGINDEGRLGRSMKFFVENTGQIAVDRYNTTPEVFEQFVADSRGAVQNGDSIALHAEGTRNPGVINKFKAGAALIAVKLFNEGIEVPLVPTAITYKPISHGFEELLPQEVNKVTKRIIGELAIIQFGEPIYPEEFAAYSSRLLKRFGGDDRADMLAASRMTSEIENRVVEMTGQNRSGKLARLRGRRKGI